MVQLVLASELMVAKQKITLSRLTWLELPLVSSTICTMHWKRLILLFLIAPILLAFTTAAENDHICPEKFSSLPACPANQPGWSPNIQQAYCIIQEGYDKASQLLRLEEPDPLRLRIHSENLFRRLWPILQEMEDEVGNDWTLASGEALLHLVADLETSANAADEVLVPVSLQVQLPASQIISK